MTLLVLESAAVSGDLSEVPLSEADDRSLVERVRQAALSLSDAPTLRFLKHNDRTVAIQQALHDVHATLLVIEQQRSARDPWQRQLLALAPCDTMLIRPGKESGSRCEQVLVPVSGGPHARVALKLGTAMVEGEGARVTALTVQPDIGDDAMDVGARVVQREVNASGVRVTEGLEPKIMLSDDPFGAIAEASAAGYDLVMLGASEHGPIRRILFGTVPKRLMARPQGTTVAVLRRARPLVKRAREALEHWVQERVPQLAREERVELFERLEVGSRGGVDFYMLTGLATAIAALGLIQGSPAVVIGAMLVAPLMTPMIGAGLGVVQGNVRLVKESSRSIFLGFLMALGIGVAFGLPLNLQSPEPCLQEHFVELLARARAGVMGFPLNLLAPDSCLKEHFPELVARGHPGLLDLLVAFLSGVAAAYASARPGLMGALPGVAIAAALVPPIATCGISIAVGETANAQGAVILFVTNLVLIILGSAFSLYLLGVRVNRGFSAKVVWSRRAILGLVLAALALAFCLSSALLARLFS
ncbi:DUF389 domain-containing protein [Planctomycetota bacterium]